MALKAAVGYAAPLRRPEHLRSMVVSRAIALRAKFSYDYIVGHTHIREMKRYEDLKSKWRGLLEQGTAGSCFDLERLAPGSYCVLYADAGGDSMACYSEIQVVGLFADARDFLGFLRFAELPRVLDHDTDTNRDPFPDVADAYLIKYGTGQRERIDHLIGMIDRSLRSDMISDSDLSIIRDKFNEAFTGSNPEVQILAMGGLTDVLGCSHLEDAFEEALEAEIDEDEQPCTKLQALLNTGEFNEYDDEHLALAKSLLEYIYRV